MIRSPILEERKTPSLLYHRGIREGEEGKKKRITKKGKRKIRLDTKATTVRERALLDARVARHSHTLSETIRRFYRGSTTTILSPLALAAPTGEPEAANRPQVSFSLSLSLLFRNSPSWRARVRFRRRSLTRWICYS